MKIHISSINANTFEYIIAMVSAKFRMLRRGIDIKNNGFLPMTD